MNQPAAHIVEIFSGLQGEGIRVGERQIFVRFAGCNLACAYCDTPDSRVPPERCVVERRAGSRTWKTRRNPLTAEQLAAEIARLDRPAPHASISLTGGEPLLSAEFIRRLIPLCGGRKFYLETNGTLPRELRKVVRLVDVVAMDIKLRSATRQATDWRAAREFLRVAAKSDVFVKVVIGAWTTTAEIRAAARLVASVSRSIPLILQPVTPEGGVMAPTAMQSLRLCEAAGKHLRNVRLIPQVHKLIGQK